MRDKGKNLSQNRGKTRDQIKPMNVHAMYSSIGQTKLSISKQEWEGDVKLNNKSIFAERNWNQTKTSTSYSASKSQIWRS